MTPPFALRANPPAFVVVDDFYDDPDAVREFALQRNFRAHPDYHKGWRTDEPFRWPGLKERFEQLLGVSITNWENYGWNGVFQFCVASDQVVYHSDRQRWAGVVYLTPDAPPGAGTTLYRSRELKLRRPPDLVDAVKLGLRSASEAEQKMYGDKLLDPSAWEAVDVVGNVYNRLVLWDGRLVHAASSYFGDELKNGRLFQLFFFDSE